MSADRANGNGRNPRGGKPQRGFKKDGHAGGKSRRNGEFKRAMGDRKPRREGDFKPRRDGEFKPRRDGNKPTTRDGAQKSTRRADNPRNKRREFKRADATRTSPARKNFGRGGTRGAGKSDRGGAAREYSEAERIAHSLRPVRAAHTDPEIPDTITAEMLPPVARNELRTLEKSNGLQVAKHLAAAAVLIYTQPELAHQHALSAARRAGRIPVTRETLAITAYALGDYALALRELATYRRLSGRDNLIALMVDCERGLNRSEKALAVAASANLQDLNQQERVQLAIACSGARLDLNQPETALAELEVIATPANKVFAWSHELFTAYAAVYEQLGQLETAERYQAQAEQAEAVYDAVTNADALWITDALDPNAETTAASENPQASEAQESRESSETTKNSATAENPATQE